MDDVVSEGGAGTTRVQRSPSSSKHSRRTITNSLTIVRSRWGSALVHGMLLRTARSWTMSPRIQVGVYGDFAPVSQFPVLPSRATEQQCCMEMAPEGEYENWATTVHKKYLLFHKLATWLNGKLVLLSCRFEMYWEHGTVHAIVLVIGGRRALGCGYGDVGEDAAPTSASDRM